MIQVASYVRRVGAVERIIENWGNYGYLQCEIYVRPSDVWVSEAGMALPLCESNVKADHWLEFGADADTGELTAIRWNAGGSILTGSVDLAAARRIDGVPVFDLHSRPETNCEIYVAFVSANSIAVMLGPASVYSSKKYVIDSGVSVLCDLDNQVCGVLLTELSKADLTVINQAVNPPERAWRFP